MPQRVSWFASLNDKTCLKCGHFKYRCVLLLFVCLIVCLFVESTYIGFTVGKRVLGHYWPHYWNQQQQNDCWCTSVGPMLNQCQQLANIDVLPINSSKYYSKYRPNDWLLPGIYISISNFLFILGFDLWQNLLIHVFFVVLKGVCEPHDSDICSPKNTWLNCELENFDCDGIKSPGKYTNIYLHPRMFYSYISLAK